MPVNNEHRAPAWKIGVAAREEPGKKEKVPEPGKYEYKTFIGEGPRYTMRPKYDVDGTCKEKRCPKVASEKPTPGPGYYDAKDSKGGPIWTIKEIK